MALISGIFLALAYASILVCEILAPYNLHSRHVDFIHSPPQRLHFFHEGRFVGPFVYGREMRLNMDTLKREYTDNFKDVQPLRFFCRGDPYRFWGFIDGDFHLMCPRKTASCSSSGPTGWDATCSRASSMAGGCRCRSGYSASP
jgi:peptide/nickel transport system permease protein